MGASHSLSTHVSASGTCFDLDVTMSALEIPILFESHEFELMSAVGAWFDLDISALEIPSSV